MMEWVHMVLEALGLLLVAFGAFWTGAAVYVFVEDALEIWRSRRVKGIPSVGNFVFHRVPGLALWNEMRFNLTGFRLGSFALCVAWKRKEDWVYTDESHSRYLRRDTEATGEE